MLDESDEIQATWQVDEKVSRIEKKVDWIAALVIGGLTLFILDQAQKLLPMVFGGVGKTVAGLVSGVGLLIIPAALWVWYDNHADRSGKVK